MKILYIADGRSPIAINWINYFIDKGHDVHLVSTFACQPELDLASITIIPVAFSHLKQASSAQVKNPKRRLLGELMHTSGRTRLRQWFGILSLPGAARRLRKVIEAISPDIVHAMRIPFEGMMTAHAQSRVPTIISVWGNDFTLHAKATPWMARLTRQTLISASGLHTDCHRDEKLAFEWGYPSNKPVIVLPGGGGIHSNKFYPPVDFPSPFAKTTNEYKQQNPVVINPRGFRAYVRNDTFFRAIPLVIKTLPNVTFLCPGMEGVQQAENWVKKFQLTQVVQLMPSQPHEKMAELFRQAQVTVSLTTHDGTPNTLLEAMACGCFPIVGNLASLQEWINHGKNGLLVDPGDEKALADAIILAIQSHGLRQSAREYNVRLIAERADYDLVMQQAMIFYQSILAANTLQ